MSNINLYQSEQEGEKNTQAGLFDKGLIVGVLIFGIFLAIYGGVEMYLRSIDKKITDLKTEEIESKKALNSEDVNAVASFQQRLDIMESGGDVFAKNNPAEIFKNIQSSMVSGVVASAIGFKGKVVEVAFVADDFEMLAKQVMSFKQNVAFRDVQMVSSMREEDGKINAEVTIAMSL